MMNDAEISSPSSRAVVDQGSPVHELELADGECDISDEELTLLALSADPEAPLEADAVPLSSYLSQLPALLPDWYMPGPTARRGGRWRTVVVVSVVAAFLVIEALGLCSTFGSLSLG